MKMIGLETETVYRRYAIVDESMLREASDKLAVRLAAKDAPGRTLDFQPQLGAERVVIECDRPIKP